MTSYSSALVTRRSSVRFGYPAPPEVSYREAGRHDREAVNDKRLHLSRPVFAGYLRTNPRTLENWEQGRAKPNAQASLLIRLVEKFPDTVDRLAAV